MTVSNQTEERLLQSIEEAVGPQFAWLRVESMQSLCLFKAKEIVIPAVTIPFGKRKVIESLAQETGISTIHIEEILTGGYRRNASAEMIDAFSRLTQCSKAEVSETLASGRISRDPAFRELMSRHLNPLAERVKEALSGIETYGLNVSAIVLEMDGGVESIFLLSLQDLLPDQYILSFESLGLEKYVPDEADESIAPQNPEEATAALLGEDEEIELGRKNLPITDTPAYRPYRPMENDYVPPDSGFLSWLAFLSALCFIGLCGFLWYTMNQMNHRLDAMTLELQRIHQDEIANAGSRTFRADTIPPIALPPDIPLPKERYAASAPSLSPAPNPKLVTGMLSYLPPQSPPPALIPKKVASEIPADAPGVLPALTVPAPSREALTAVPAPRNLSLDPAAMPPASESPEETPDEPSTKAPPDEPSTKAPPDDLPQKARNIDPTPSPKVSLLPLANPIPLDPALTASNSMDYQAISASAGRMTLNQVMKRASERSFTVSAARWRQAASDAVQGNAFLPYNFQWGMSGNFTGSSGMVSSQFNSGYASFGVYGGLNADIAGRKPILKKMQVASARKADASLKAAIQDSQYDAASYFLDALSATQETRDREEILALTQNEYKVAQQKLSQGMSSRVDVQEAVNRLQTAQNDLTTAMAKQETAEINLGRSARVTPGYRVEPASNSDMMVSFHLSRYLNQDPSTLAAQREDVMQAAAEVSLRSDQVEMAKKDMKPSLSAYGGVPFLNSGGQSGFKPLIGVQLTLPLNDGGQKKQKEKEERAVLGEGQTLYELAVTAAVTEIASAQVEAKRSQQILNASLSAVDAGRDAVKVSMERYEAGYANFTDLLQSVSQLDASLSAYSENRRNALRAQLKLLHVSGGFPSSSTQASEEKGI